MLKWVTMSDKTTEWPYISKPEQFVGYKVDGTTGEWVWFSGIDEFIRGKVMSNNVLDKLQRYDRYSQVECCDKPYKYYNIEPKRDAAGMWVLYDDVEDLLKEQENEGIEKIEKMEEYKAVKTLSLINNLLAVLVECDFVSIHMATFVFNDEKTSFFKGLGKLQIIGSGSPWKLYIQDRIIMPDPANEKELLCINTYP